LYQKYVVELTHKHLFDFCSISVQSHLTTKMTYLVLPV